MWAMATVLILLLGWTAYLDWYARQVTKETEKLRLQLRTAEQNNENLHRLLVLHCGTEAVDGQSEVVAEGGEGASAGAHLRLVP